MSNGTSDLVFIRAKANKGVPPLSQYYEEIFANQIGLESMGLRGDKSYLFYSKNGHGIGYYEQHEMDLAAESFYDHFLSPENQRDYFNGVDSILNETRTWCEDVEALTLSDLSNHEIAELFLKANQLHGRMFSYYVVSQPYRIVRFEEAVKAQLRQRVAKTRVDHYLSLLATSEKSTRVTDEAADWLRLVLNHKKRTGADLDAHEAQSDNNFMRDFELHFNTYKILTLGDGVWEYSRDYFMNKLDDDGNQSVHNLERRLARVTKHGPETLATRLRLIDELYLEADTINQLQFLSDLGHSRFTLRTEGWIPNVRINIKLDIELSERIGYERPNMLNYLSEKELLDLVEAWRIVPPTVVLDRMGIHEEYLMLNDKGKYSVVFGDKARESFRLLVPPIDHSVTKQLTGTTAVQGVVTGQACVYQWGDDLNERLDVIKKYPILVAGQTRPAMMPLIRLAHGIITDEGGITSHAAIVSRELGIPSIIGTTYSTQIFKDGDMIELDADNGVVRLVG